MSTACLEDAEHAISRLRALGEPEVWSGHEATWTALAGGHYDDWLGQLRAWLTTLPRPEAVDYRIISAIFFGAPADSEATGAVRYLEDTQSPRRHPHLTGVDAFNAKCWLAQWTLARGGDAGIEVVIRQLRQTPFFQQDVECAALLELALVEHRHGDVRGAALRLDSISLSLPSGIDGDFYELANLVVARTFLRLGDPARALAAARRRCYGLFCDGMVLPSQRLAEARAAAEMRDTSAALRAYDEYLLLRGHAEGPWRAEADSARAERALLAAH